LSLSLVSAPFHVQRWLAADIVAPHDGEYAFRLGTCGGVRVWRSGEQLCFTPFTRNQMQHVLVRLALREGKTACLSILMSCLSATPIFAAHGLS
jgi:hypothetical protein